MSLLVFDKVSLSLGGRSIVEDLSLRLDERDRVGLIGPNGSGKTTLLRLISREQSPDGGSVRLRRGARVGYLPQDVVVETDLPLLEYVLASVPGRTALDERLLEAEGELSEAQAGHDTDEAAEERMMELAGELADLHERISHFDRYYSRHEAERILAGLGFVVGDHERPLLELSGGWRMRAVLASLLFQRPELLLLDEPTNHLDMPSVAWLSGFLERYDRAFILISHDREFLNEQIRRVISFEPEGVRTYTGDYEAYLRQREEERVVLENQARNVTRKKEQLERFVTRFKAKASKAAQARSKLKQLEKLDDVETLGEHRAMSFRFPPTEQASRHVLKVEGLTKRYGDHTVLDGVDLFVNRGDRIALIGVNGAGKTTLLRTLAGEIEPTEGKYSFGHKTKVGYYAQHHADVLDRERTVLQTVENASVDGEKKRIRGALGALLFSGDTVDKKIGVLSGGERARVALATLLVDPGNVLLMDEPTNHLDLQSSERLAEALETFDGTLLFVSHNRGFLRRLATKIWVVADGKVEVYPGTLDDYLYACKNRDEAPDALAGLVHDDVKGVTRGPGGSTSGKSAARAAEAAEEQAARKSREADKARKRDEARRRSVRGKVLRPLEKRVAELEATIARLEAEQADLGEKLSDPKVFEDAAERDRVMRRLAQIGPEVEVATDTWMETQEELDRVKAELEAEESADPG